MSRAARLVVFGLTLLAATAGTAAAQPLGVFRWQLQPFCNIISVVVTATGSIFTLQGTDDQCGGPQQASAVGTAFQNPDGTIGLGFTIIGASGGQPGHVDATVTLPAANGTWRDSNGASGSFVLTPGAGIGGNPRPSAPSIVQLTRTLPSVFTANGLLRLNDANNTIATFNLNAPQRKLLTFSAECAVNAPAGTFGAWVSIDILHNGVELSPTAGPDDAFCAANGTLGIDGWTFPSVTVVIPGVAGANQISINARLVGTATSGRIDDSVLVIR